MRILAVSPTGILDTATGEVTDRLTIQQLLTSEPGGVIAGNNLYELLAHLIPETRKDEGWTVSIHVQQQRVNPMNRNEKRVTGLIYVSKLTYRKPKQRVACGVRKRPPAIKWLVLNLELFTDSRNDVLRTATALIGLAHRRGIKPRYSPGSFGSALLRSSPEWRKGRQPAPHFISEIAREHLPGNFYVVNYRRGKAPMPHAYYIDQQSSHHTIASTIPLPNPYYLRARGRLRSVEQGNAPQWIDSTQLHLLRRHIGLLCCRVDCSTIPPTLSHLYPPWALEKGSHVRWIWTPELRLLDNRSRLRHISCALTSIRLDPALLEYAHWSLEQLREDYKIDAIKSSLLAAYGMLACRTDLPLQLYTVHGRKKPPRAETCELPLLTNVYRSTVERTRVPTIQNVVARGVIEAETRTRSIEYARQLEGEGIPVAQIYADGLLAATDQLPLLIPEHWRVAASLTRVSAPHPNQIISDQLVRLPGIERSRREAYVRDDGEGMHLRELEPRQNRTYVL